jgi:hypothetical protein
MAEKLLNLQIILFAVIYFFRTLLITGYEHLKFKRGEVSFSIMALHFIKVFFSIMPLSKKTLEPRGFDHKVYVRFQRRFVMYYFMLWILLFSMLFFTANIYLKAFNS